jgi:WhiB family redox-sensing transcriptional regulator
VNTEVIRYLMESGAEDGPMTISVLFGRPVWQQYGACRGQGTDEFIIGRGGDYDRSRQLCADCPVSKPCLEFALADSDLIGMWGGTSERQRREIRAGRRVA